MSSNTSQSTPIEPLMVNCSRIFKCQAKTVWKGIESGAFFAFTGTSKDGLKMDFKEGGEFRFEWDECPYPVGGRFLQIIPEKKLVFTWNKESTEKYPIRYQTQVTIDLFEHEGTTLMTLIHEGFESAELANDHFGGWDQATQKFMESLRPIFEQFASQASAPDFYFRHRATVNAPVERVFEAVRKGKELARYFPVNREDDFVAGQIVHWKFENYPEFQLKVHHVEENRRIKFVWDEGMHVCFSFRSLDDQKTQVHLEFTCSKNDQKALNQFVSESEGWGEFLMRLKLYLEKSLVNRDYQ